VPRTLTAASDIETQRGKNDMAAAKKAPAKKAVKTAVKKAATGKSASKKAVARKAAPVKAAGKANAVKKASAVRPAPARPAAPPKSVAKPAPKPAAKAAPKPTAAAPAARTASARVATSAQKAERVVAPAPSVVPVVAPSPVAPKAAPAPSPKDLAAAHEYLLARSATRSEEPVTVDGRRLPTEGELLKMLESDYMNDRQLAFFKHRLQQMERELLQNADETTEHLRETVIVPDPADRATIEEEHALELRTRDRERKLLKKVQQSLARIEAGDYGYCEETGDPIGIPRLLARPTATLSLEAQQRREIKQKMYGD
jgi:DnaK suppressor protein